MLLDQFTEVLGSYINVLNRVILDAFHPEIASFDDAINWVSSRRMELDVARQNVEHLASSELVAAVIPPEGTSGEQWMTQLFAMIAESHNAVSYVFTSGPPQARSSDPRAVMAASAVSQQLELASKLIQELNSRRRFLDAAAQVRQNSEVPEFIRQRASSSDPVVAADEVAKWPRGLLERMLSEGVLRPDENAKSISCDACGQDHAEQVEFVESPPGSKLRAYITCPENGRVQVPLDRLRRWLINPAAFDDAPTENNGFRLPDNVTHTVTYTTKFLPTPAADDPKGLRDAAVYCRTQAGQLGDARAQQWWVQAQVYDRAADEAEARLKKPTPAGADTPRSRNGKKAPEKQSWTQPALDAAIREYKAKRAASFNDLVEGVRSNRRAAKASAQKTFGRNAIARELGVKAAAMVSKSPEWQAIADELKLPRGKTTARRPKGKVGLEIALEEQASERSESAADVVVQAETIRLIQSSMSATAAEATIERLRRGEINDDQARELVEAVTDQVRDARTRKVRSSL